MLRTRTSVGTPLIVSKFDFSDNFVSAQIQNFTSWHCSGVNLVDCGVSCIDGRILKEHFYEKM